MLAQLKLYALGAFAILSGVLYSLLKMRGNKLKAVEKELELKDAEIKTNEAVQDITTDLQKDTDKKEKELEIKYGEALDKVLEKNNTRELTPSMRELLNNSGAARSNTTST